MIRDVVNNSMNKPDIIMSDKTYKAMTGIRKFMFENVYSNPVAKGQEFKAKNMLISLYEYYLQHLDELPEEYIYMIDNKGQDTQRVVCDYIAGMSDQYSVTKFEEIFVPSFWKM